MDGGLSRRELLKRGAGLSAGLAALSAGKAPRALGSIARSAGTQDFRGITIRVVTRPNFDAGVPGFKDAIPAWGKRTGGKVVFQTVPFQDIPTKYAGYVAAQDGSADILWGFETVIGQFGPTLYDDLTHLVTPAELKQFIPGCVQAATVSGKLYGVPADSEMLFFIYNKKYFADAGIDPKNPPRTWAALYKYAPKLNTKKYTANDTTFLFPEESIQFFDVFLNSTKTRLLSRDLKHVAFNNADGLAAFQTWYDGIRSGFFNKKMLNSPGELYDTGKIFNHGGTASMMNFSEIWGSAVDPKQSKVAKDVGTSLMPGIRPGTTGSINAFESWGVNKFGSHKDAALSFIREMTSRKQQATMMASRRYPSSRIDVLADPLVRKRFTIAPLLAAQGRLGGVTRPGTPYYHQMEDEFSKVLTKLSQDKLTPKEALAETAKNVQQVINDYYG